MAATYAHRLPITAMPGTEPSAAQDVRRRIPREAAHAMRTIGRVIEYVANEFLHDEIPPGPQNPRLQAVELLMGLSRQIYLECPEMPPRPSLRERCGW